MKRDDWVFAISGTLFGLLVGWMLGTQQAASPVAVAPTPAQATAAPGDPPAAPAPPPLDERRASDLQATASKDPSNYTVRVDLGNLYFDSERYDLATPWYEAAMKLNGKSADVSTDLAVCYYNTNQIDRALTQLDTSLKIDPKHLKTWLNIGVVRAFGKQDLPGAMDAWQQIVTIAPDSEEAKVAKQALNDLKSGHANLGGGGRGPGG